MRSAVPPGIALLASLGRSVVLLVSLASFAADAQGLKPWAGGATPSLALRDLEGRQHRLEDYRGKVVLVNFWATWCEPCREEMPAMQKLRAALAGRPFEVLAVNLAESEARIRRFTAETPIAFPVLLDRDGGVAKSWRARVLPVSFVIGPQGKIRYSVLGELDWSEESIRRAIVALMPADSAQPRGERRPE